ncbi:MULTISPECIES: LacI family DNA-binding transcriptional regulator [Pseudoalteromonas]|mgnify:CR=1 FL=1|uniref:Transcriptional regulator n=1 Tax=Pseudoalteromonas ruthenica TaxID=151081 RepID=A0A0F4PXH0_9GAMM|nr:MULTISPECIES: LacI family DNA-binding transcriptional regulator [Pseudoalteromonas]KJY99684.1 transcriptional regulator [Pseudoalteromonas ruthenica]KJZ00098.1 transcriptional regulator [Pseudoalteromonas ruthenica]MCG7542789.1 LacI family DNA-binding transcriptional regulator [Pseudoalteromonas sp. MM17-2]MCG7568575.1 LacI family DNA-binding transcriptional regulator [Pseudoalteromonas sp. CNC9-20]QFU05075.1 Ribose operon repressor [Pseudoalteromonas sp. THAF3]|tara:strand:+ start:20166 stop:21206 length:1041 start_codon:yes stop_codon:yes gene_type:complete
MKKITINSVASYAGVSKKTVSRVLNNEPNVSDATREKVLKAFKELDYTPNPIARGLARNRSFIIGCLYDNPSKSYITRLQSGALAACHEHGFNLLIHPCELRAEALLENIEQLLQTSRLDGLVLTPPFSDHAELVAFLRKKGVPFARVASVKLDDDSISVRSNDEQGAFEITELLINMGHKDIAFIKGHPDHSATEQRFNGYRRALKQHGIEYQERLVEEGNFSYHSGADSARTILHLNPRPTAVFASNDYMAAAALKLATQMNLKVPDDISIAGFDNAPIARHIWPGLTTIAQPVEEMTRLAVDHLIEQINHATDEQQEGEQRQPLQLTLEAELITRESTAAPKA